MADPVLADLPILEHDPCREAVIEPARLIAAHPDMPRGCVLCFFQEEIRRLAEAGRATEFASLTCEMGTHPVYRLETAAGAVALFHPGVGAPLAGAFLEEAIALGGRCFVACGGAGVLDSGIAVGTVLVPTAAVRDEGTSYHYLPPAREVALQPGMVEDIERVLQAHDVPYLRVKTWTTDAFYRETRARVTRRRQEGCACVEMEAAALAAVAQFRGVAFGQLLYGGDDLGGAAWDSRGWLDRRSVREHLVQLAAETAAGAANSSAPRPGA